MSQYASTFKKVADAKPISDFAKNIGVGKHIVALKSFCGKTSQKTKVVFNKGEGEEGTAAEKAEELAEAIELSKMIATAEQAGHVPGPIIALSLDGPEARYRWIKDYEAEAVPGGFDIYVIASKHFIKRTDEENPLGPVDLKAYLPKEFEAVGEQVSVDMSSKGWRSQISGLDPKADHLYVVRNAETGEVLKVGKTSDLELRLKDYRTAANTSVEHGGSVTVDVIEVKKPPGTTLETGEGAMRDGVSADAKAEATANGGNPDDALPGTSRARARVPARP